MNTAEMGLQVRDCFWTTSAARTGNATKQRDKALDDRWAFVGVPGLWRKLTGWLACGLIQRCDGRMMAGRLPGVLTW